MRVALMLIVIVWGCAEARRGRDRRIGRRRGKPLTLFEDETSLIKDDDGLQTTEEMKYAMRAAGIKSMGEMQRQLFDNVNKRQWY